MSQDNSLLSEVIKMRDLAVSANYNYSTHNIDGGDNDVEDLITILRDNLIVLPQISDCQIMSYLGIALGRYLEGDHYDTYDEEQKEEQLLVVGLTLFTLTRAINSGQRSFSAQWHRYRFSTCWEYDKSMKTLLSHARDDFETESDYSEPMSMVSSLTLSRSIQVMYLSDGLVEPGLLDLDSDLRRIFYDEIRQFADSKSIIAEEGYSLYQEIYEYLIDKFDRGESDL